MITANVDGCAVETATETVDVLERHANGRDAVVEQKVSQVVVLGFDDGSVRIDNEDVHDEPCARHEEWWILSGFGVRRRDKLPTLEPLDLFELLHSDISRVVEEETFPQRSNRGVDVERVRVKRFHEDDFNPCALEALLQVLHAGAIGGIGELTNDGLVETNEVGGVERGAVVVDDILPVTLAGPQEGVYIGGRCRAAVDLGTLGLVVLEEIFVREGLVVARTPRIGRLDDPVLRNSDRVSHHGCSIARSFGAGEVDDLGAADGDAEIG